MSVRNFYRSKRSRQKDLVEAVLAVVNDTASGMDVAFIKSVVKQDTGEYLIEVKEGSNIPLIVSNLYCAAGFLAHVEDSTESIIEIHTTDLTGTPADADFTATVLWFKGNRIY